MLVSQTKTMRELPRLRVTNPTQPVVNRWWIHILTGATGRGGPHYSRAAAGRSVPQYCLTAAGR